MDELLTTKELSKRIKMAEGTILNLVSKKVLKLNVHYYKPSPKKNLYSWTAIEKWIRGRESDGIVEKVKSYINV